MPVSENTMSRSVKNGCMRPVDVDTNNTVDYILLLDTPPAVLPFCSNRVNKLYVIYYITLSRGFSRRVFVNQNSTDNLGSCLAVE